RDARLGGVEDDVAQRAGERLAPERGREVRPLLGIEPRMGDRAVVVLERAAPWPRTRQLDAAEPHEHANVIGDVAQRRVKHARQLVRTRLARGAEPLEDALT